MLNPFGNLVTSQSYNPTLLLACSQLVEIIGLILTHLNPVTVTA